MIRATSFFLMFIIIPCLSLSAQQADDSTKSELKERDFIDSEIRSEEKDYDDLGFIGIPAPKADLTAEVVYGNTYTNLKNFAGSFGKTGIAELRFGQTKYTRYYEHLVKLNQNYMSVSGFASALGGNNSDISPDSWRFGLYHFYGYGYRVNDISIVPYSSNSFVWTRLSFKRIPGDLSQEDLERLDLFNGFFRFGMASEGGIKVIMAPFLTFSAGYEKSVVLPRYVFLQHFTNLFIEYAGLGAIDEFVKRIIKSSPNAAPVINFVLKNGFSYACYQLRKDKMNWPFESAAPVTMDSWKIGLTFIF